MRPSSRHGVVTASGYGLRVWVERSHLLIDDGVADQRRRRRFSRIDRSLQRLVVVGTSGSVSLEAVRWLHDVGVPLVHLGGDGKVYGVNAGEGPHIPQLRRAQAAALETGASLAITRHLVGEKLNGQMNVTAELGQQPAIREAIVACRGELDSAATVEEIRLIEAQAAIAYWGGWRSVPVRFEGSGQKAIPDHWRTVGSRLSLLSGSPRRAVNPANAMLNYCYAILEAEARIAALAVGCDPSIGVFHADLRNRDSLACDLMEAVRPEVDRFVLKFLGTRAFTRRDFLEVTDGGCRLLPSVTEPLGTTALQWAQRLAPVAEYVARRLLELGSVPSPADCRAPRPAVRRTGPANADSRLQVSERHITAWVGQMRAMLAAVPDRRRRAARRKGRIEARQANEAPPAEMQSRPHIPPDSSGRVHFQRQLLPLLRRVPAERLAAVTGLSMFYCARIRAGACLPHRRHWDGLLRACVGEGEQ